MTGGCSFSVCSLFTDVRESVSELPREPDELKKLLIDNLGFGGGGAKPISDKSAAAAAAAAPETQTIFKHPISYTDPTKLYELSPTIIEDLEMIEPKLSSELKDNDATEISTVKDYTIMYFHQSPFMAPNICQSGVNIIRLILSI